MSGKGNHDARLDGKTDLLDIAKKLYSASQQSITDCRNAGYGCLKEIEICFQISARFWAELRKEIVHHEFTNRSEEIEFFKRLKPMFTSEIEYYGLCYHAQLYKATSMGNGDLLKFWNRELKREEKFIGENIAFYLYYTSGDTRHDGKYFTRAKSGMEKYVEPDLNGLDKRVTTSHDHLVASIMALEKYTTYVKIELDEIAEK